MFNTEEYKAAFTEAYRFGLDHAHPMGRTELNELYGVLNRAEGLKRQLLKGVIEYLCRCYFRGDIE